MVASGTTISTIPPSVSAPRTAALPTLLPQMVPVSYELDPYSRLGLACGKLQAVPISPRGSEPCSPGPHHYTASEMARLHNKVNGIREVTLATMAITTGMYIAVGISGYVMYGSAT